MAWYKSPFVIGRKYCILKDYSELGHIFCVGDIMEATDDTYDPKLGVIRFWFRNISTGEINAFHVWEETKDLELLAYEYFKECT